MCMDCDYMYMLNDNFTKIEKKCSKKKCNSKNLLLKESNYAGQRVFWEICPKCDRKRRYSKKNYAISGYDLTEKLKQNQKHLFICPQIFDSTILGCTMHLISHLRNQGKMAWLMASPDIFEYIPLSWNRDFFIVPDKNHRYKIPSYDVAWLMGMENLSEFHRNLGKIIKPEKSVQVLDFTCQTCKRYWAKSICHDMSPMGIPEWVWNISLKLGSNSIPNFEYLLYGTKAHLAKYNFLKRDPLNAQFLNLLQSRSKNSDIEFFPKSSTQVAGWEIREYHQMAPHDLHLARMQEKSGNEVISIYPTGTKNLILDVQSKDDDLENASRTAFTQLLKWDKGTVVGTVGDVFSVLNFIPLYRKSPLSVWPKSSFNQKTFKYHLALVD